MRNKNKNKLYHLPLSGQIIGEIFRIVGISYPSYLSKEMQRYFRGENILDDNRKQILFLLVEELLDKGIIPDSEAINSSFVCQFGLKNQLVLGITQYALRWDELRTKLSCWAIPYSRKKKFITSCLRLIIIDLAVRLASLMYLEKATNLEPNTPFWVQENGNSLYLKQLMERCDGKKVTREDLIAAAGIVNQLTITGWFNKGKRPTQEHLKAFSEKFAKHISRTTASDILKEINRQYIFSELFGYFTEIIGRDALTYLVSVLYHYTARIRRYFEKEDPNHIKENNSQYLLLFFRGINSSHQAPVLKFLLDSEPDFNWKRDIVCVERDWFARIIQQNLRLSGETVVNREHENHMSNLMYIKDPSKFNPIFEYISATNVDNVINDDLLLWTREKQDLDVWEEINKYDVQREKTLREAVLENPDKAETHKNLGVYLAFNTGRANLEEGYQECIEASKLRPDWDLPLIEITHVLLCVENYSRALAFLDETIKSIPRRSSRLLYTYGFTKMINGDWEGALLTFLEVIGRNYDYSLALDNIAYCAFRLNRNSLGRKFARRARLHGISTTYDMRDVGKLKKQVPILPFKILCETVRCNKINNCPDYSESIATREKWRKMEETPRG